MYIVSWTTDDERSDYELFETVDKAQVRIKELSAADNLWSWTVSLAFYGSDPQHFDYEGMPNNEKADLTTAIADILPADYGTAEIGATFMSILSSYGMSCDKMALFFKFAAEIAEKQAGLEELSKEQVH